MKKKVNELLDITQSVTEFFSRNSELIQETSEYYGRDVKANLEKLVEASTFIHNAVILMELETHGVLKQLDKDTWTVNQEGYSHLLNFWDECTNKGFIPPQDKRTPEAKQATDEVTHADETSTLTIDMEFNEAPIDSPTANLDDQLSEQKAG